MPQEFILDQLRMNAVQTAPNGVIGTETIFSFSQEGKRVWATYAGGRILKAFLVGVVDGTKLSFRYCQLEAGEVLNGGVSDCELRLSPEGLIQIIEHFAWESQVGSGMNIIQEIPRQGNSRPGA